MLLNKPQDYTPMVLDTFEKMETHSCHALDVALADTQDNQEVADAFKRRFEKICKDIVMYHTQLSFYRCA